MRMEDKLANILGRAAGLEGWEKDAENNTASFVDNFWSTANREVPRMESLKSLMEDKGAPEGPNTVQPTPTPTWGQQPAGIKNLFVHQCSTSITVLQLLCHMSFERKEESSDSDKLTLWAMLQPDTYWRKTSPDDLKSKFLPYYTEPVDGSSMEGTNNDSIRTPTAAAFLYNVSANPQTGTKPIASFTHLLDIPREIDDSLAKFNGKLGHPTASVATVESIQTLYHAISVSPILSFTLNEWLIGRSFD